jgi:hypothetical protein
LPPSAGKTAVKTTGTIQMVLHCHSFLTNGG